jgi:hypothetical protein
MKCLICSEDIADRDFPTHVNIKHDGRNNPWNYIMLIQKRLEEIQHNLEKSHGPMG